MATFTLKIDCAAFSNSKQDCDFVRDAIDRALRDFADWIYSQLEKEYEYQMSNECVDENIRANEYEFTEEGMRA